MFHKFIKTRHFRGFAGLYTPDAEQINGRKMRNVGMKTLYAGRSRNLQRKHGNFSAHFDGTFQKVLSFHLLLTRTFPDDRATATSLAQPIDDTLPNVVFKIVPFIVSVSFA